MAKIVICRCEDVTRKEFVEACEKGYLDLESVKRYTGFGTGWCQGKQCVGLATRELIRLGGKPPDGPITPRQPYHPVPIAHLASLLPEPPPEEDAT